MTKRIFGSIMLISTLYVIAATVLLTALRSNLALERDADKLSDECMLIASGIECSGGKYLDYTYFSNMHITWLTPDRKVIFDSSGIMANMENAGRMSDVNSAFSSGMGMSIDNITGHSTAMINCAKKLSDGSVIRVSAEHSATMGQLAEILPALLGLFFTAAAITILYAYFAARRIVAPINSIDLDAPDIRRSYSELSPLLQKLRDQNGRINMQMEELRQSSRQLSLIMDNMTEGFVIADPKTNVLICNSAAMRFLGADGSPENVGSIYSLNRPEPFRRCIQNAMGGIGSRCIIESGSGSGECEIIASPANIAGAGWITVLILDVTKQRQLEAMRREFTSNVSHELKTPLTTIYGSADLLANGLVKPEHTANFGRSIRAESSRMISLIEDIISLSKLDEGS